ncbi:hypothetical protein XA68_17608 [Ophiocordyceps unilateralis]|uniref:LEA domain-containing protein n=1 Tax=Ophiocordyceps unilateralis TaxID=268505 RepID=A0A2A9P4J1_OPHUN|nr:hypothetical protein XA68_17608 [Ophiocordyceps unilateralis]
MSFATHRFVRLSARPTTMTRIVATLPQRRAFTSTSATLKTATETVKDGLKSVDRTVSDNVLVPGLDAAAKAKESVQSMTTGDVKQKAAEVKDDMAAKTERAKGDASAKAEELKGDAKAKTEQAKGHVKGAAEEAQSKL